MIVPHYTFLSVVRTGMAGAIPDVDTGDSATKGRATFKASFSVTGNVTSPPPLVTQNVRVNGPSDVMGLDPRQVIRTEPKALTQNYEPNFFAAVEFDRPDFLWMMTPARETDLVPNVTDPNTASARLRPWVALVAVRRQDGVALTMPQGQSLPVLEIKAPAVVTDELQGLEDSWAWAHAQIVGDKTDVTSALATPAHNSSRLLCPHRLKPLESYIAAVVPAFKIGVSAGLGIPVSQDDESKLDPAWTSSDTAVKLPVYFHFEFNTGPNGDFEALADLLVPTSLTADDVTAPFEIGATGDSRLPSGLPPIRLDGALTAGEPPAFDDATYKAALATIVNQAKPSLNPNDPDPIVAPPLYGRWHAAQDSVSTTDGWLADLNLDPRRRVAAGLGTRIVQEQQEQLMASAWDQLGEIQKINQTLRRAQLAREAMSAAHAKTVASLQSSTDRSFAITSPVLGRLLADSTVTLAASLFGSRVPNGLAAAPLRRLIRPRGAVGGRLFSSVTPPPPPPGTPPAPATSFPSLVETINAGALAVVPARVANGIVLGTNPVSTGGQPIFADPTVGLPDSGGTLRDFGGNPASFKTTTTGVQTFLTALKNSPANQIKSPSSRPQLNVALGLQTASRIHPSITLPARVLGRIFFRGQPIDRSARPDPLEPILAAPEFPQPMYAPLRDLSPDNLLPGLFRIPPNTVTLLDTNRQFVEAFLAGLNHEMARELLWRGYPTDQRGTYFAQFWDPSCRVSTAKTADQKKTEADQRKDITPMHLWTRSSRLGDHEPVDPTRTSGDEVVLVVRGELLRRYPNTIIYAAPAKVDSQGNFIDLDETKEELPIFRGTIPPDVTFLGFNLTEADVRTRQLYFVLQEQPTEPRFGLNEVDASQIDPNAALTTWEDLSWGHFGPGAEFIRVGTLPTASSLPNDTQNPLWGVNGAHMAQITLQTPVRVAIFGPDILPTVTGP